MGLTHLLAAFPAGGLQPVVHGVNKCNPSKSDSSKEMPITGCPRTTLLMWTMKKPRISNFRVFNESHSFRVSPNPRIRVTAYLGNYLHNVEA